MREDLFLATVQKEDIDSFLQIVIDKNIQLHQEPIEFKLRPPE
jgi:hypothetical protein